MSERARSLVPFVLVLGLFPAVTLSATNVITKVMPKPPTLRQVVQEEGAQAIEPRRSQADRDVEAFLTAPAPGWTLSGALMRTAQIPQPFSCASKDGYPVAASATFVAYGVAHQLTAVVFGPGGGAAYFEDAKTKRCDTYNTTDAGTVTGLGVQSMAVITAPKSSGARVNLVSWRRGDVVVFLSAPVAAGSNLSNLSLAADAKLKTIMGTSCINQNSVPADKTRSPHYDPAGFIGLLRQDTVTVPAVETPKSDSTADVVPLDFTPAKVEPVVIKPNNRSYPVWPNMPNEVKAPTAPKSPGLQVTTTTAGLRVVDEMGPGCGWAYTASQPASFDKDKVDAINKATLQAATDKLKDGQRSWNAAVLKWYKDNADYSNAVNDYILYAKAVLEVEQNWAAIDKAWAAYYNAHANWTNAVRARDTFLVQQAAAKSAYDAGMVECKKPATTYQPPPKVVPNPNYTPAPTPTAPPTGSTDPAPSPTPNPVPPSITVTPTPQVIPAPPCPTKPAILDQAAPVVGPEPSAPADPRPKN